ncbi:hypothetical protein [Bosea sp. RAC05]|uniref:hypothetical protein n=1 Tax=Bosea sp. RAC05 TaxID=1842539 RepID=UPI00083D1824|nr:hypothetical protein [Bosea sp. RAC05]AOG03462.1 hypothetical protein BSY19_5344 [Bosea sp. RAC05]
MKHVARLKNFYYAALAAITLEILSIDGALAQAGGGTASTVGDAAQTVTKQVTNIGKLGVAGCFLVGIFMTGAGLMKLKEAAAAHGQGQVKYSDGIWRVAVGAGLAALPAVVNMTSNSGGLGGVSITNASGF